MFSKKLLDINSNGSFPARVYDIRRFPSSTARDATFSNALDCFHLSVWMCHTRTYHAASHLFQLDLFASQKRGADSVKLLLKFSAWPESLWCSAAMIVPNAQTPRVTSLEQSGSLFSLGWQKRSCKHWNGESLEALPVTSIYDTYKKSVSQSWTAANMQNVEIK